MKQGIPILICIIAFFAFIAGFTCGYDKGKDHEIKIIQQTLLDIAIERAQMVDPDDPNNPLNR